MAKAPFTTGIGYDIHSLATGLTCRLCGVDLPFEKGFVAHSDGDVAVHALCDALLGAADLGDIGQLFPPSDAQYKGISSLLLLDDVVKRVHTAGFEVGNVDLTILAERPKIAPHIKEMKKRLASSLGNDVQISIKATTHERIGCIGREEGIAVLATCLLLRRS